MGPSMLVVQRFPKINTVDLKKHLFYEDSYGVKLTSEAYLGSPNTLQGEWTR